MLANGTTIILSVFGGRIFKQGRVLFVRKFTHKCAVI